MLHCLVLPVCRARALDNQCYVAGVDVAQNDEQQTVCFGRTQVRKVVAWLRRALSFGGGRGM